MSLLDQYYRKLMLGKIYANGWGSFNDLLKLVRMRRTLLASREPAVKIVGESWPVHIDKETDEKDHVILEGHFRTPFYDLAPELSPEQIKTARFEFVVPKNFRSHVKPVTFHFASTGDEYFWRRRILMAKPLLSQYSYGSLIMENPYYGSRKPKYQNRSNLLHVKDLFIQGGSLVMEALVLLKWCERMGFGPFLLTGVSLGGHIASTSSTVWPKPLACVPCLSWTSASSVFTRGVMSAAIPWALLDQQLKADKRFNSLKEELIEVNAKVIKKHGCRIESFLFNPNIKYESLTNFRTQAQPFDISYSNLIPSAIATRFSTTTNAATEQQQHHQQQSQPSSLNSNNSNNGRSSNPFREAVELMQLLMDDCTHLMNYDTPLDTSLIHVLTAKDDAYVLRDGLNDFESIWPGARVDFLNRGHVSAFLLDQSIYRTTINQTMNKLIEKYHIKSYENKRNANTNDDDNDE